MWWQWCCILVALGAYFFYQKYYKPIAKLKKRGVKFHLPWPVLGNGARLIFRQETFLESIKKPYNDFSKERYYILFNSLTPTLCIRDLDLIKQITIKEFDHFVDHHIILPQDDLFDKTLIILKGNQWREMRSTLSPAFTSSKMRGMFSLMEECAKEVANYFTEKKESVNEVELKDVFTKYTNDVIASSSFGIKCDSLKDPENEFYAMGKKLTTPTPLSQLKVLLMLLFPIIVKILKIPVFDKAANVFFRRIVKETIQTREAQNIFRPDMIHLLMEARKGRLQHETTTPAEKDTGFATVEESNIGKSEKHQKKELTDDDITAQAVIFFFAGFETSAVTMSFMGYELAANPDVQSKLAKEIDEVWEKFEGKPTYEEILKMKYMDQVLTETLRKWTPGVQMDRECTRDFTIEPIGPNEQPYHLKKGDQVVIPTAAIHYDPKYFPNPERFDPERFSEENKDKIVSGSYNPFGVGPRNCIGSRFAILEIKILYFYLLRNFEIVPTEKTVIPIEVEKGISFRPKNGFQVGLKKRKTEKII